MAHPAGDELSLYDPEESHFHALNATAARVWAACDGEHNAAELAVTLGLPEAHVELAVAEFAERGLLVNGLEMPTIRRRDALRRLAAAGVLGVVALPQIASITGANSAALAASCVPSGGVTATSFGRDCCNLISIVGIDGIFYCNCVATGTDVGAPFLCEFCCSGSCGGGSTTCA